MRGAESLTRVAMKVLVEQQVALDDPTPFDGPGQRSRDAVTGCDK